MPPSCFNRRRNEISVTQAMGESTSGGLISISLILKGLILCIRKKPHEILPHVAFDVRQWRWSADILSAAREHPASYPRLAGRLPAHRSQECLRPSTH